MNETGRQGLGLPTRPDAPLPGARSALLLLLTINLFNYLDRQVLAAVVPNVRADLFGPEGVPPEGGAAAAVMHWMQGSFGFNPRNALIGSLAMANSGPNTNGSQFFVTTSTPQWLSGKHTIFGEVIAGYDVVEAISKVPRGAMDRPNSDVVLEKVEVLDKAPAQ